MPCDDPVCSQKDVGFLAQDWDVSLFQQGFCSQDRATDVCHLGPDGDEYSAGVEADVPSEMISSSDSGKLVAHSSGIPDAQSGRQQVRPHQCRRGSNAFLQSRSRALHVGRSSPYWSIPKPHISSSVCELLAEEVKS